MLSNGGRAPGKNSPCLTALPDRGKLLTAPAENQPSTLSLVIRPTSTGITFSTDSPAMSF